MRPALGDRPLTSRSTHVEDGVRADDVPLTKKVDEFYGLIEEIAMPTTRHGRLVTSSAPDVADIRRIAGRELEGPRA